jgi:acyl-coenzyme A thioesterase PaaI-like protein
MLGSVIRPRSAARHAASIILGRASNLPRASSTRTAHGVHPAAVNEFLLQQWPEQCADFKCHEVSAAHCLVSYKIPSAAIRPGGYISGPAQFATADLGLWVMCWARGGFEEMALTSELSIRFLRPAIGKMLWARVDINAASGRQLISTATMWTDANTPETVCSVAQGTYVLPRKQ